MDARTGHPLTLDEAWQAAEAALPDGIGLELRKQDAHYRAMAFDRLDEWPTKVEYAATPAAALEALAQALRRAADEVGS